MAETRQRPQVVIVGLGYIGLPTSVLFARSGVRVHGVDINRRVVELINAGQCPIVEPGLDPLVSQVVDAGTLTASTEMVAGDTYVIAVPTPITAERSADMSFVQAAALAIAPVLEPGSLVILESTSPVGATERLAGWLADERPDLAIAPADEKLAGVNIAYCPERVLPGRILDELVTNDRLVGGLTPQCARRAVDLYRQVVDGDCHLTTARTAELTKLTENSYRDVNIAFANELSVVADELDVDVDDVVRLANLHPRVNILTPGPGVGGHCIPVDPWFIVEAAESANLIKTARVVNDAKPAWAVDKILDRLADRTDERPTVALLGLSYKPDVDDLRESPSIDIATDLAERGEVDVVVVEPHISELPIELAEIGAYLETLDHAIERADLVVGLVAHAAFTESRALQELDPARRLDFASI